VLVAGAVEPLSDNFLLVANDGEIVQVDSETMNEYRLSLVNVTSQPQVLVYDWLWRHLYWTSATNTSAIFKYSARDQTTSVLYVDPASTQPSSIIVSRYRHCTTGGRLALLSARPAVTPATLKRAATNFAAW